MTFYSIATYSEAKAIIDRFGLKKSAEFYESDDIKLVISGMGAVKSAVATTKLLSKYEAKKDDVIFNIGVAGANFETSLGSIYEVKKVVDFCSKSILTLKGGDKKLITYPSATYKCDIKNSLVDMEGYGFLASAKEFIDIENIMIKKVVSDLLDPKSFDKAKVYEWIRKCVE